MMIVFIFSQRVKLWMTFKSAEMLLRDFVVVFGKLNSIRCKPLQCASNDPLPVTDRNLVLLVQYERISFNE